MSTYLSRSLLCLFTSRAFNWATFYYFLVRQSSCRNASFTHLSWLLVYGSFLLFVVSLYPFVFLFISGLSVLVQTCLCLSLSQWDPRLSVQPVMRCMLQSACEELIRKQQRPSHINRHVCVCVCIHARVCLGSLPGTLMAVCRPMGIDLEGKADRNEFWSTEGLHSACLSV